VAGAVEAGAPAGAPAWLAVEDSPRGRPARGAAKAGGEGSVAGIARARIREAQRGPSVRRWGLLDTGFAMMMIAEIPDGSGAGSWARGADYGRPLLSA